VTTKVVDDAVGRHTSRHWARDTRRRRRRDDDAGDDAGARRGDASIARITRDRCDDGDDGDDDDDAGRHVWWLVVGAPQRHRARTRVGRRRWRTIASDDDT